MTTYGATSDNKIVIMTVSVTDRHYASRYLSNNMFMGSSAIGDFEYIFVILTLFIKLVRSPKL